MPIIIVALLGAMGAFYFLGKPKADEDALAMSNSSGDAPSFRVSAATSGELTTDDYTSWMTVSALDDYIREQNQGHEKTFWERGHWMTAVEGRVDEGVQQYRIAYQPMPKGEAWHWRYRVNQTRDQFLETLRTFDANGFTLLQSQAFIDIDNSRRYQSVWRKKVNSATVVENSSPSAQR